MLPRSLKKVSFGQLLIPARGATAVNVSNSESLKPYDEIPTVSDRDWPVVGHLPSLMKKGVAQHWKRLMEMKQDHVPEEINMIRLNLPAMNPANGRVQYIFDPQDVETVYRNDGQYPDRGGGFDVLKLIRERRPDLFGETTGVVMEEGPRWHDIRKRIQQDMMRPKSAMFYIKEISEVAKEFVEYVRRNRDAEGCNKEDFLESVHKYAFESISIIAIDTKMGCLRENPDPVMLQKLEVGQKIINIFPKLLFTVPTWNFSPPRWNPIFREAEDVFSEYADFISEKVKAAVKKIQHKIENTDLDDVSVLEKLIIRNGPNSPIPFVNAFDMVTAGIDTTGNTLGFFLYNLALNPEAQQKLREEISQFEDTLTEKELGKMRYFRACLRETFRTLPTIGSMSRVVPHDISLKGYHIPAGTMIAWSWEVLARDKRYFPDPEVFRPERWLDGSNIHPFSSLQFSYGVRSCVGKRFAELEMILCLAHLLKHFKVEWAGNGPVETNFVFNL